jgi:hypothetical protein
LRRCGTPASSAPVTSRSSPRFRPLCHEPRPTILRETFTRDATRPRLATTLDFLDHRIKRVLLLGGPCSDERCTAAARNNSCDVEDTRQLRR